MPRVTSRRTAGAAALLPALFLAALYVAAPFAGTTTHAIAHQTSTTTAGAAAAGASATGASATGTVASGAAAASGGAAADGSSASPAHLIGQPVHMSWAGGSLHTMLVWYGAIIVIALAIIAVAAAHYVRDDHDEA